MGEEENKIVRSICDYLSLYKDMFFWRQNNGAIYDSFSGHFRSLPKYGVRGVSDILGVYKGHFLAIEVKRRGGQVSHFQKTFLKSIIDQGGIGFVAYSIDDVRAMLGDPYSRSQSISSNLDP